MSFKFFKGNRISLQVLLPSLVCIGLIVVAYATVLGSPLRGRADAQQIANSTKTAVAMTAGALLNPFPTATVPTVTASAVPTFTSTLPTATPTVTRTPTKTPTLIQSPAPHTRQNERERPALATRVPPSVVPPTKIVATNPPPPTDPPAEPPTEAPTDPPVIDLPPVADTLIP